MKAFTQMIVRASDPDSVTDFILAEDRYHSSIEQEVLREMQKRLRAGNLSDTDMDAIQTFADMVKERRARFDTRLEARRVRAAGLVRK